MSLQDFSRSSTLGSRAEQLSNSMFYGPLGDMGYTSGIPFSVRFSILGIGVYYIGDQDVIAAFVEAGSLIAEGARFPLIDLSNGREALGVLYGENASDWSDCIAIGIRSPEMHMGPGDTLTVSSSDPTHYYLEQGSCGAPVSWGNNRHGFLTAGHVAHQVKYDVEDANGKNVGTVVGVWDSAQTQTGADVAVVEITNTNIPLTSIKFIGPKKITNGPTKIDLHLPGGNISAQVLGNAGFMNFPNTGGTYLDLYMTGTSVTAGGDSGSPVTLAGLKDLVGHVIAGSGSATSFIQDAQYQLTVIKSMFTNISL